MTALRDDAPPSAVLRAWARTVRQQAEAQALAARMHAEQLESLAVDIDALERLKRCECAARQVGGCDDR